MFESLQKKWGVGAGRLVLILITFAVGGSLTGYAGKWIMDQLGTRSTVAYVPIYIIVVTIVWPMMVLLVSVFTGQFLFFKKYLGKMGRRISGRKRNAEEDRLPRKGIAIFASGAGSNAQKIIDYFKESDSVSIAMIVCNKPGAGVVKIAEKENIPLLLIEKEKFFRGDGYVPELKSAGADLLVLAGFLWKIPEALINNFQRRIINIHPALLPGYGGKGMYGSFVHEAVLNAGDVQSGITIHYVDEHYDNGDIIFQTACPVLPDDDPSRLAERIHQLEYLHYPKVIEEVVNGL